MKVFEDVLQKKKRRVELSEKPDGGLGLLSRHVLKVERVYLYQDTQMCSGTRQDDTRVC